MSKHLPYRRFSVGLRAGIPIALGYVSVSFGFGISAVNKGLSPLTAILISLTNLTSAGQVAGLGIIAACGTFGEMALAQLTINIRYFLMSLALSQKLDASYSVIHRLTTAFGVTDEVFGVASAREEPLTPSYMYGLILLPFLGWALGTTLGALAGNLLPDAIKLALGIAIYGMFVAIVVPPVKKSVGVLSSATLAIAFSLLLTYLPFIHLTSGFIIILAALPASLIAAAFFPMPSEKEVQAHE